jgi:hypothetical protein
MKRIAQRRLTSLDVFFITLTFLIGWSSTFAQDKMSEDGPARNQFRLNYKTGKSISMASISGTSHCSRAW